jgi:hypothetical protein
MTPRERGRAWAEGVYQEKLANPANLPNLGRGYTNEHRAARAVHGIADRKLYTRSGRGGHPTPNALRRDEREFWLGVAERAGELGVSAEGWTA